VVVFPTPPFWLAMLMTRPMMVFSKAVTYPIWKQKIKGKINPLTFHVER